MQGPSTVANISPNADGSWGSTATATPAPATPAATAPAHRREDVPRTDFSQYSHQELIAMLAAADPAGAHRTAAEWEHTAALMSEQATALDGQLSGFSDNWQGDAASSYQVMIKDLAAGVRQVADHARRMRDLSAHAADALDTARAEMPAPVEVPSLSPEMMAMASTPIAADPTASPTALMQAQQQQGQAIAAVQQQQAAQGASDAAHAKAVQVMTTLADSYTDSAAAIPASPYAADGSAQGLTGGVPAGGTSSPLFGTGSGVDVGSGSLGDLVDPVTGQLVAGAEGVSSNVPLFGSMFTAGLAAASAASVGRFGSLLPKLPSFLTRRSNPELEGSGSLFDPLTGQPVTGSQTGQDLVGAANGLTGAGAAGAGGAGAGGAGGMPSLGSMGGFGGGGLGGIGGGAVAGGIGAAAPSAYTAMAGSAAGATGLPAAAGVSGLSAGASGVASGVAGATGSSSGMPMGMMPMGAGMGGGMGMDGARRSPAWLVETDDVWGEQSVVAPSVVGDDLPLPDPRPWITGR